MNYLILHDYQKPLCFIGDTWHNHCQHAFWSKIRHSELVSLEHAVAQDQSWWNQRQFMCAVTNVAFKKQVVSITSSFTPDWFSVVDQSNSIATDVYVGKNTLINLFNSIYTGAVIGDHVTITNFNSLSHNVVIDEMCHISPYTYVCYTHLEKGVCVGLRSSFAGKPDKPISVKAWCNITMDSRITDSVTKTGTWYGNRRLNLQSSLDVKLL